jgi:PAS domain S-box-containing protein
MAYQITPFMPLYATIFLLTFSLGMYAALRYLRYDRRLSVLAFAVLMFSISSWEISELILEAVVSQDLKLITHNIINGIVIPVYLFSLLFFALAFSEKERWIKWAAVASAVPLVGLSSLLFFFPEFLYESHGLVMRDSVTVLGFTFEEYVLHDRVLNPSFRMYALYSYFVTVASAAIVIRYIYAKKDELYTEQSVLIGVGISTPLFLNVMVFFGILLPNMNFTDVGFGVTAICFALAIFRYRLFQVPPVGRPQLFDAFEDPLFFVDDENRVVYSNPKARQLFGVGSGWKGTDVTEIFASRFEGIQPSHLTEEQTPERTVSLSGTERCFDVSITPVQTPAGDIGGRIISLRDVTKLEQARSELEKSNERLDEFASMLSHDLRTPLNVAAFRTELIAEERSDEHTEAVQKELDRMESMIDGMLRLARAGEEIETTEDCSLREIIEDVWESVETDGAELDCRVGNTDLKADPVRIFQLFENLFGNAVYHNETPLTVRVGTFDENGEPVGGDEPVGFFVEDDGEGIPEDERDEVFEHGYTTGEDGHGYGLSVVRNIVEAHGWEIRVTDGSDGGARFEITGIGSDQRKADTN